MVQLLRETVWRVLKKVNVESPYDPEIPLLSIHPKELEAEARRDVNAPMFTAALSTLAKRWMPPTCPSAAEWINKMWAVSTQQNMIQPGKGRAF